MITNVNSTDSNSCYFNNKYYCSSSLYNSSTITVNIPVASLEVGTQIVFSIPSGLSTSGSSFSIRAVLNTGSASTVSVVNRNNSYSKYFSNGGGTVWAIYYSSAFYIVDCQPTAASIYSTSETSIAVASLAAQSYKATSTNVTKSGYWPLFISGFSSSNRSGFINKCYLTNIASGSVTLHVTVSNPMTAAFGSSYTMTVYILWEKIV